MVSFWKFTLFLYLEHLCLILHFPSLSVLMSMHYMNQAHLLVFTF